MSRLDDLAAHFTREADALPDRLPHVIRESVESIGGVETESTLGAILGASLAPLLEEISKLTRGLAEVAQAAAEQQH